MLPDATIGLYVEIAKITGFLASKDTLAQETFNGAASDARFPRLLYIIRKNVEFLRVNFPDTNELTATALYMYSLCGKYIQLAYNILGQTGTIVNPSTGGLSTLKAIYIQFTVGDISSPMSAGDTIYVVPYNYIQNGSIDVFVGGALLPQNQTDQFSYSIVYKDSSATITFNQGVQNTQLFMIKGQYFTN
jgi:hypothetical protein